jgi:hypothetical protein
MRRVLLLAGLLVAGCSGSGDRGSGGDGAVTTTGGIVDGTLAAPACLEVSPAAAELWDATVTAAVPGPHDFRGARRWYYASPTGGVWISGTDPTTGESNAVTAPLNDQARAEDIVGVDIPADDPALDDASADSSLALQALDCAMG